MRVKEALKDAYEWIDPYALKLLKWYIIYHLVKIGIGIGLISLFMFIAWWQLQAFISSLPKIAFP